MTEIILVRHGETDWNREDVFRGRTDIPLNQTGVRQAKRVAIYLAKRKLDAVLSSPLKRAFATAELVAQPHKLAVEKNADLIDFNYGEWQGLSHDQVKEMYGELYQDWLDHPEQVTMPGGENLDDVRVRALWVIQQAVRRFPKGVVVFVSHEVVGKVIVYTLLGLDHSYFWNIHLDNCGVTTFLAEASRFILASHNETSFLGRRKRRQKPPRAGKGIQDSFRPHQPALL
ncbi:MAG: histidine phosphatase family protein [Chloroflexota bacterium]